MTNPDLLKILNAQRAAFDGNPNPPWEARKANLKKLGQVIAANEAAFQDAISQDFGNRAAHETTLTEMLVIQAGISHALKHTKHWMRRRKVATGIQYRPGTSQIVPQPLGVVGIISPWNYPLMLAIMPLIGALGAGNRVMIKPSENTPKLSLLMKNVLAEVFTDTEVHVAIGGVDVAQEFSSLPFDHLLFTGSTNVGRMVACAAAKNLTPVTLELGGKSPVIIDDSIDMDVAVARIVNGKLMNAGQTCVAPDYILMPADKIDRFADGMIAQAEKLYPTIAGNPDYTSIISESHYARLQRLLDDAESKGARIRRAGADDRQKLANGRLVPLSIVTNTTPDMLIMQEEIFGPLLPIVPSDNLEHALDYIGQRERPLALYWFGNDTAKRNKVLAESISGGVSINEIAWHLVQ
ncbi:MAG: coniferyl aldehyde dehydrogenase, partial [Proteobacteria bacterium]|nr:coniferyl aldehyde dehydrogenase [Pseudomonadota bacterium]